MKALVVNQLSKEYKTKKAVHDISFSLETGEVFALLGRNGAGKSTTINMLTGILTPTSGTIEILNTPYRHMNKIKQRIGVLPDNSNYYSEMTAIQHMKFFAQVKGVSARKDSLVDLLESVGLGEDLGRKIGQFSLGMRKKLGIAQALIGSPELIFLDEPTSTLDVESALQIRQLIGTLASKGITIFMTSHNLEEIERICDRVAILNHGKIEKMGTLEQLREAHTRSINITIKYQASDQSEESLWLDRLQQMAGAVQCKTPYVEIELDEEEVIPEIVQAAVECKIRIYSIERERISLENIFLDEKLA
ncbi:ATP-binding cassette domain-containing protein [Paenibacillus woosongensis]|uniref:ATP-binding cassette domain-containing protein n=1 Tax=Paenibacillus woosongensis TaxID=307580 RepID=A0A7X2Z2H4_9BACL|nr:ABC transporter ATP-binding protein [Paenibacillus woosongensis]MUG46265.1 ATP-binding cassette domain-containing protein [Paenibacillus woosongensis]